MNDATIKTIILAAGQGTRMHSLKPKVLHLLAGKPLLKHVYAMCQKLKNNSVNIVYGHGGEQVPLELHDIDVHWVQQEQQLGTGHAVQQALNQVEDQDVVLILYGDVPLLKADTVKQLLADVSVQTLALLTVELEGLQGYGRIVRNKQGQVIKITEEKDATDSEKLITEGNTGIIAVNGVHLKKWLAQLDNNNAQKEYYLTDIIAMAANDGITIATRQPQNASEVMGVNDRSQLSYLERIYQLEQTQKLMKLGVAFADPNRFDLRGRLVKLGQDVEIDINVILVGDISLGNNVKIGANTSIKNSQIGDDVVILENCVIDNAVIGAKSKIGPYARLRPQTHLAEQVHIGNFVEIKKSNIAQNSKINHLSYIGDAVIGSKVNVGAGTITCNYDGANKWQTIIEDGVFIGSDTQLVAPVTVGENATIGAGSTITKNAPATKLTLSRAKQISIDSWQKPDKEKN